jgi:hypothetical protein
MSHIFLHRASLSSRMETQDQTQERKTFVLKTSRREATTGDSCDARGQISYHE